MATKVSNFRRNKAKQLLAEGSSIADALRGAGYAESTAVKQHPLIVGPIKRDLAAALERTGLTDDKFAEQIFSAITSTDAEQNWPSRIQAMRLAAAVRGDEAPKHVRHSGSVGVTVEEKRHEQRTVWERLGGID